MISHLSSLKSQLSEGELGLKYKPAITCFTDKNDIPLFENFGGVQKSIFYQVKLNTGDNGFYDKLYSKIQEFEKRYNGLVYLVLVSHTVFGTLCDFFYVSDERHEWADDTEDLKEGYQYVYCYNMDDDMCSEIGEIGFKDDPVCGGIYRCE